MATSEGGPAPSGDGANIQQQQQENQPKPAQAGGPKEQQQGKDQKTPSKEQQPAKADAAAAAASGEKKLSNAELKKKAKEEKAARRAQAKAAQPASQAQQAAAAGSGGQQGAGAAGDAKGGRGKPRQDSHAHGQHGKTAAARAVATAPKEKKPAVPECFSHLSMAKRLDMSHADKDVHPAVLVLGQHMSTFAISDSITRLEATLLAFKKVIDSYTTPHGTSFSRHFTSHVLNPQIEYLTACRPMCFSMGNAVRWLKLQISKIDIDLPDYDAKKLLCESIDNFIRERITLADLVIVRTAADMIEPNGEVILTYAHHHLVERTLLQAKADGKHFRVIVVDDPFERVGVQHARTLSAAGIPVTYASDLGAVRANLRESSRVLVASEAMFSNGATYARAGTCDIATVATDLGVRVVTLCETINFTERVSIDSLTYNEIDPERNTAGGFRLLFDTTRDKFISVVVTELGNTSATSVPAVLRKLEEL